MFCYSNKRKECRMLKRKYKDDGKEFLKLNNVQKEAKESYMKNLRGGGYKEVIINCDCGADIKNMKLLAKKDRYGLPLNTVICKKCGLIMSNPTLDQESLNSFYDREYRPLYVGENMATEEFFAEQYSHGKKIYEFLKENIDVTKIKTVLEIGTGAGGILKAIEDNQDVEACGIDLGGEYIEFGKMHGLNLYKMHSSELALKSPHKYDLIILSHVLEHFLDLKNELAMIKELLSSHGYLYIEVPGIKNVPYPYGDFMGCIQNAHIRSFTLDTLKQVLAWNGFSLVDGNEIVQSIFIISQNSFDIKNYYKDNYNFLRKWEKKWFFLIHFRYPLAKISILHKIYEVLLKK